MLIKIVTSIYHCHFNRKYKWLAKGNINTAQSFKIRSLKKKDRFIPVMIFMVMYVAKHTLQSFDIQSGYSKCKSLRV